MSVEPYEPISAASIIARDNARLTTENRRLKREIKELCDALSWVTTRLEQSFAGTPIRDGDEVILHAQITLDKHDDQ